MQRRWNEPGPLDPGRSVEAPPGLHATIASILASRGIAEPSQLRSFLQADLTSLEPPSALPGLNEAVKRLREAISLKQKTLIFGDYDADGVTASAILCQALERAGLTPSVYIPNRLEEGYGLNPQTIKGILKRKPKLLITVDNGIAAAEPIREITEAGIDVIVVDHHESLDKFPATACAVVRPLHKDLAACGLAFKLAWGLLEDLEAAKRWVALAAIGTVADMAPLTGDNRILVRQGLQILRSGSELGKGLEALIARIGTARFALSYRDIAFMIAPRINASGRMGSAEAALRLLTTDNELEAKNLSMLLHDANLDRQRAENSVLEEAIERVEADRVYGAEGVLVVSSRDWHEGVLGIVASRLVERYRKPAIVICEKEGECKGSGRSIPGFNLLEAVQKAGESLTRFGGHAQACGLTLSRSAITGFRNRVNALCSQEVLRLSAETTLAIDAQIDLSQLTPDFFVSLERLAPFGPGNPKPFFISKGLRMKQAPVKKDQRFVQGWVADAEDKTPCEIIGFGSPAHWFEIFSRSPERYDIVHLPVIHEHNGIRTIRLELEDLRAGEPQKSA